MKRLLAQAKLHEWQLTECRRRVLDLEGLADCLQAEIAVVERDLLRASGAARAPTDGANGQVSAHLHGAAERRTNLERSLSRVRQEMEEAREAVRLAFQELRKYELAIAARQEAEAESGTGHLRRRPSERSGSAAASRSSWRRR